MTLGIMIVSLIFMGIGMLVQSRLKSKFAEYGKVPTSSGLSGKEVAEKMLRDNGIYDVQVVSVDGFLSDHYNPLTSARMYMQGLTYLLLQWLHTNAAMLYNMQLLTLC